MSLAVQTSCNTKSVLRLTSSSVVLLIRVSDHFIRRTKDWRRESRRSEQAAQADLNSAIRYMATVPTQQYIHLMNAGERNMRHVTVGCFWQ
jgi:hypothetical protein